MNSCHHMDDVTQPMVSSSEKFRPKERALYLHSSACNMLVAKGGLAASARRALYLHIQHLQQVGC
jgi:hypothetical protein